MNKKVLTAFITAACLILSGCNNSESIPVSTNSVSKIASENIDNTASSYVEYTYKAEYAGRLAVSAAGDVVVDIKNGSVSDLMKLNEDGTSTKLGECPGIPESMSFMGDDLYVLKINWSGSGTSNGIYVWKIGQNGKENEIYTESDIPIELGYGMSGNKNELYILAKDSSKENAGFVYNKGGRSYNIGSVGNMSLIRVFEGKCEKLPVDAPTAVCAEQDGGALIAASDDNGIYLVKYKDGVFSEKIYAENIVSPISSIGDIDDEHIVFNIRTTSDKYMLCASDMNNMSMAELIPGLQVNGERLYASNGYCYFQSVEPNEKGEIVIGRIRFSDYYKYNAPVNLICSRLSRSTPFGCGYTINVMQPENEEAALKILSQDRDYDMCYISTNDEIAYSIKSQGSFYLLNDVPGVSDYLDKCFPEIKDAFIDENGEIWALPIYMNTTFIFSNCGDTDYSKMNFSEFADFLIGLSPEEYGKTNYTSFAMKSNILTDYVTKYDSFDTEEFRAAAENLKKLKSLNRDSSHDTTTGVASDEQLMCWYSVDVLRTFSDSIMNFYDRDFKVSGIPCIFEPNMLVPVVTFLSVNPNSEHLSDALDYIERLTQYQLTEPNTFIFKAEEGNYTDTETVKQMIDLCAEAKIHFRYPDELYWDSFNSYLTDEISLDDFITEADRKLKTYLNE